jgi:hypothetical protein
VARKDGSISRAPEAEFAETRLRNLRRHAIENRVFRAVDPKVHSFVTDSQETTVDLKVDVSERRLLYFASVEDIGDEEAFGIGVGAFSWAPGAELTAHEDLLADSTPTGTVTLLADDDLDERWPEIEDLIDRTLAVGIDRFSQRLS